MLAITMLLEGDMVFEVKSFPRYAERADESFSAGCRTYDPKLKILVEGS